MTKVEPLGTVHVVPADSAKRSKAANDALKQHPVFRAAMVSMLLDDAPQVEGHGTKDDGSADAYTESVDAAGATEIWRHFLVVPPINPCESFTIAHNFGVIPRRASTVCAGSGDSLHVGDEPWTTETVSLRTSATGRAIMISLQGVIPELPSAPR